MNPVHDSQSPAEYWESKYTDVERVWSGRVNAVLAEIAPTLTPGRALDLGSGEGADVMWLATKGWDATGLDVSPTAVERSQQQARMTGLDSHTRFKVADLETWETTEQYDLITASFLQSLSVPLQREAILQRATQAVAANGHMLIVAHAGPPSWAGTDHHHDHQFPTPEDDLAMLDLDLSRWDVKICQIRERTMTGPDGAPATVPDSVILIHRRVIT